jgi:hypothetical protein
MEDEINTEGKPFKSVKSEMGIEYYDSSWEHKLMKDLDKNPSIVLWTKNHFITIPYWDEDKILRQYKPDFFIKNNDGKITILETVYPGEDYNSYPKIVWSKRWAKAMKIGFKLIEEDKNYNINSLILRGNKK